MKRNTLLLLSIMLCTDLRTQVSAPISIGDLVDKITILQVKLEKIEDPQKRININYELKLLLDTLQSHVSNCAQLDALMHELKDTNSKLWDIENGTRAKEAKQEFDDEFIALARSVYFNNNHRHTLKRTINILTGSRIIEEKQYTAIK